MLFRGRSVDADEPAERAGCEFNWTECLDEPGGGPSKKILSLFDRQSRVSPRLPTNALPRVDAQLNFPKKVLLLSVFRLLLESLETLLVIT